MKKCTIIFLSLLVCLVYLHAANENIAVIVNHNTGCIQLLDSNTNRVSGAILKGELGSYSGGLNDVVITSDGNTAIVSNFGDRKIFFIDISGGFDVLPQLLGSAFVSLQPLDLALTPDDKYVLVTNGGYNQKVSIVNVSDHTVKYYHLPNSKHASSVEISPDGQLVLFAEFLDNKIHACRMNSNGMPSFKETQSVTPLRPTNISISPDSKTAIVLGPCYSLVALFSIDSNHDLVFKRNMPLQAKGVRSCIFSPDGKKAYIVSNWGRRTNAHILNVNGPGNVSDSGVCIPITPARVLSHLLGVDNIAVDPLNRYLYYSNSTNYLNPIHNNIKNQTSIAVIDLISLSQVDFIKCSGNPLGIAFPQQSNIRVNSD